MSYALETRKRKFDRLIESLNESPKAKPPSTSTAPTTRTRPTTVKEAIEAAKRRRVTPTAPSSATGTSTGTTIGSGPYTVDREKYRNSLNGDGRTLASHYLPSSRAAFLERLETYRHITKWHVPSTIAVNAAEWAKRGWICIDVDTVACGACSERVLVDLSVNVNARRGRRASDDEEKENENVNGDGSNGEAKALKKAEEEEDRDGEEDVAGKVYEALVKRYEDMIITSHSEGCPWRKRGCDASIQKIEGLLHTSNVIETTRARLETIMEKIGHVPSVLDLPAIDEAFAPRNEDLRFGDATTFDVNATKLAVCGWHYREADVIECKNCFRSLGLWLYRGDTPTIEHLDAVESHLEYCPWRSALAQDTEFATHHHGSKETKVKFPGWALVYAAIQQHKHRQSGGKNFNMFPVSDAGEVAVGREEATPEQREKKVKDLIQRIKEIKKPFNVKSLLRKKDKPER